MHIGYFGFNNGPLGTPDAMRRVLGALDSCGFESAWTGEHVVAIDPQEPPSPIPPEFPMLDTIAAPRCVECETPLEEGDDALCRACDRALPR